MHRLLHRAVLAALLASASCVSFKDKRTPSGEFCSDMPIVPAGQEPDREYHRLQPIQSDSKARTEAERLESLRKVACGVGADAVIEAVNEEIRGDNAGYQTVSSGTAVIWLRRSGAETKSTLPTPPRKPTPIGEPAATAEPAADPAATAAPAKSAKPAAPKPKAPTKTPIKM